MMRFALINGAVGQAEREARGGWLYIGTTKAVVSTHASIPEAIAAWRPGMTVCTYVSGVHKDDKGATLWDLRPGDLAAFMSGIVERAIAGRT